MPPRSRAASANVALCRFASTPHCPTRRNGSPSRPSTATTSCESLSRKNDPARPGNSEMRTPGASSRRTRGRTQERAGRAAAARRSGRAARPRPVDPDRHLPARRARRFRAWASGVSSRASNQPQVGSRRTRTQRAAGGSPLRARSSRRAGRALRATGRGTTPAPRRSPRRRRCRSGRRRSPARREPRACARSCSRSRAGRRPCDAPARARRRAPPRAARGAPRPNRRRRGRERATGAGRRRGHGEHRALRSSRAAPDDRDYSHAPTTPAPTVTATPFEGTTPSKC